MRRLWGIRHIRWLWYSIQLARWLGLWAPYGYLHASPADLDYLDAVWKGDL